MSTGAVILLIVVAVLVLAAIAWFVARSRVRRPAFKLRELSDAERERYAQQWTALQQRFVDQPAESVAAAEQVVHAVMRDRGYPDVGDDVDRHVKHMSAQREPAVGHYRDARDVRLRHNRNGVSTEDLRRALQHYRVTFESLTGIPEGATATDAVTDTNGHHHGVDGSARIDHGRGLTADERAEQAAEARNGDHGAHDVPPHPGRRETRA